MQPNNTEQIDKLTGMPPGMLDPMEILAGAIPPGVIKDIKDMVEDRFLAVLKALKEQNRKLDKIITKLGIE